MKRKLIPFALLIQTLASAFAQTTLYQTGFEPPAFTAGLPVRGQDNWEMFHDGEALSISPANAREGSQCLRIDGALLEPGANGISQAFCFPRVLDFLTNDPPGIVEIRVDVRLDGPQSGANGSIEQDFLSANFHAVVPAPGGEGQILAGFQVSSAGRIWTYSPSSADNYKFSSVYTFGTYKTLAIRIDFIGRTVTYRVDDQEIGSSSFPSGLHADRLLSGYLVMAGKTDPVTNGEFDYDPARYIAYFDNYSIRSIPLTPVNAVLEFSSATYYTDESRSSARVSVSRRGFKDAPVRVTISTQEDSAKAGEDFIALSEFITFASGETNKSVDIPLAPDDSWPEPDRSFRVRLTGLPPGVTSTRSTVRVTIYDDDRPGGFDSSFSSSLGLPPLAPNEIKYADPQTILPVAGGKFIVDSWIWTGDFTYPVAWNLARLNPDGSVDSTYPVREARRSTSNGYLLDRDVVRCPDDSLLVWDSEFSGTDFLGYRLRYRLNPDGTQDTAFPRMTSSGFMNLIPQADGKILVNSDSFSNMLLNGRKMPWLFRLNSNGTVDSTFKAQTMITGFIVGESNGQSILEQKGAITRLHRLLADGALDPAFNAPTNLDHRFLYALPDGKLLITSVESSASRKLYRLHQDGALDTSFATGTAIGLNTFISVGSFGSFLPQADGKIIIAGTFRSYNGQVRNSIVRLNPDGTVDSGFQTGLGFVGTSQSASDPGQVSRLWQLPDGRLIASGDFQRFAGRAVVNAVILKSDGTRDPSFEPAKFDSFGFGQIYLYGTNDGPLFFGTGYGLGLLRLDLPLRIVSSTRDTNGAARLLANALSGREYRLQSSDNLAQWTDVTTGLAATNRIELVDSTAPSTGRRFYRLKQD